MPNMANMAATTIHGSNRSNVSTARFAHGRRQAGACTRNRGPVASQLTSLDCVTVVQDGIDATFHVDDIEIVAAVMKPRRRRHGRKLSETERGRLADMGRQALSDYREARGVTSRAPENDHSRRFAPRGVSEVTQGEIGRSEDAGKRSIITKTC
jgi:hypothetical protein